MQTLFWKCYSLYLISFLSLKLHRFPPPPPPPPAKTHFFKRTIFLEDGDDRMFAPDFSLFCWNPPDTDCLK